ncbi:MAG: chromosomal replication initiator protein DnaA [Acidimicrobiales bacterium]
MIPANELWTSCQPDIEALFSAATFKTWLSALEAISGDNGDLVLIAPSPQVRDRVEERYLDELARVVSNHSDAPVGVHIKVRAYPPLDRSAEAPREETRTFSPPPERAPARAPSPPRPPFSQSMSLNPRYTFDNFIIGPSNRFAHAAAQRVAETPGASYNPLFIFGGSGLGKTHLLQAIGHYVARNFTSNRVRYVSTESFLNDFVEAIRTNETNAFKKAYRECDVLLVDDIQFIASKEQTQEEFFHTFNSLYDNSKQIVLTSDRPPRAISSVEDRLRSRFEWGLTTDVQPPELETRLAILRMKAEGERVPIPDDVLELIATHVKDNIRELEGALIRVTAFSSLNHVPMTLATAERVLSDVLAATRPREITLPLIIDATSETFGFSVEDIRGPSRRRPLVNARQIAMYVCRTLTDDSYPAIAREFGDRDHTTVIHATNKITELMKERRQTFDQVTELILRIKGGN